MNHTRWLEIKQDLDEFGRNTELLKEIEEALYLTCSVCGQQYEIKAFTKCPSCQKGVQ